MSLRCSSRVRRTIVALVALGALCTIYGYFIEPHWLQVNRLSLSSSKIEPGKTFRIIQISDLHCGRRTGVEDLLPALVAAEHPDLIVFTGDMLNDLEGLPRARQMFLKLAMIAPVYAIPGNADDKVLGEKDPYMGISAHYLRNEVAEVNTKGTWVRLLGTVTDHSSAMKWLETLPEDGFTILLHHCPQLLPVASGSHGVDLFLSGHTHGGQVALPWFGAIIGTGGTSGLYGSGLYREGTMHAHVNVGLGTSKVFPFRFLVRPEITVIDVVPSQ